MSESPGDPLKNRDALKVNVHEEAAAVEKARQSQNRHDPEDVAKYAARVRAHWKKEQGQKVWSVPIELTTAKNPCGHCGRPMPTRRKTPICEECLTELKERQKEMKDE